MQLESGSSLGSYEILSPLGKDGMGEVYRARDTKLGREVAIEVLPDAFADGTRYLLKHRAEARVASQRTLGIRDACHRPA